MQYIPNILFVITLVAGIGFFTLNIRKVIRNIKLGKTSTAPTTLLSGGKTWQELL